MISVMLVTLCFAFHAHGIGRPQQSVQSPGVVQGHHRRVEFQNSTDHAAGLWIGGRFVGILDGQANATVPIDRLAAVEESDLAGVWVFTASKTTDGLVFNWILIPRSAWAVSSNINIGWGAATAIAGAEPSDEAPLLLDLPNPALQEVHDAQRRLVKGQEPGKPATSASLLSKDAIPDHQLRYGILSVQVDDDEWLVDTSTVLYRRLPASTFDMLVTREPSNSVTISYSYYMSVTEITELQYRIGRGHEIHAADPKALDLPKASISWDDANQWCSVLGLINYERALPLEAEWRRACQADQGQNTNPAQVALERIMWYNENSNGRTHPVASLLPNELGLYDMHGNVAEWCADWFHRSEPSGTDPSGPKQGVPALFSGPTKIKMGGSFNYYAGLCACSLRDASDPSLEMPNTGFRPVIRPVR